ncbi:MAG: nucleoside deaminase [Neisseriaceae bacterium]|nr:nucleoside deaminase [Neisseriaceae bacterium]
MHTTWLRQAIELAQANVTQGGRPFAALLVKDNQLVAQACNTMLQDLDPTAHAELSALRAGGKALHSVDLSGCVMYASGEPCPMCQAAMYMAGIREVHYAFSNADGEPYGLSTAHIATEMQRPPQARSGFRFVAADAKSKAAWPRLYHDWHQRQRQR